MNIKVIFKKTKAQYEKIAEGKLRNRQNDSTLFSIQEREQVISYKKKISNKPQKESDDEIESANSLKSGVFS